MWGQPPSAVRGSKTRNRLPQTPTFGKDESSSARWTAEGGCPHISLPTPTPDSIPQPFVYKFLTLGKHIVDEITV